MGLVGLGSVLGLTLSQTAAPFFTAVDAYHGHFLALAVTMVMLSGSLHLLAWRLDCRTAQQSACAHTDCTPQKSRSLKVFYLSCALLVLDVLWFSLLHHH